MKVLIACVESQEVCKAFRARGHEAYSCDIQEPSGGHPEPLRRLVQTEVGDQLARMLLAGEVHDGDTVLVDY